MKYRPTGLCLECAEKMGLMLHGINAGSNGKCLTCNKVKVVFNEQRDFIPKTFDKLMKMTKDIPATDFITKDSGKRTSFITGMQRDLADDKPRFDLLIPLCLPITEQLLYKLFKDEIIEQEVAYFLSWFLGGNSDKFLQEVLFNDNNGIEELAMLLKRGAVKYEERNWEKAETQEELKRFKESAARHFFQYCFGLNKEENHLQATIFNMMGADMVMYKISTTPLLTKQKNDKTTS